MHNFADLLREAKRGRVQVFHEFLTNFDPSGTKLYCFYEGREDEIFYRSFIASQTRNRILGYICGSKDDVYGVFSSLSTHVGFRRCLFFVDKDLSDVLKEPRPIHERLFVTAFYSIENYLVLSEVFSRFCQDFIQCPAVACDHDGASTEFKKELSKFYKLILPIMAWVLAVRRAGQRPNLRNLRMKEFFEVGKDLAVKKVLRTGRLRRLNTVTGVSNVPEIYRRTREAMRDLSQYSPKEVVRGKFEAWFFVEFIKAFFSGIKDYADGVNAPASMVPAVEHSSFVQLAVPILGMPSEVERFIQTNLSV